MRVLVTGALGFVGHAVVRQLVADGHDPIALTSRLHAQAAAAAVPMAHADIRDVDTLRDVIAEHRPQGVCHLAALTRGRESSARPLEYYDVNVNGTLALLQALIDAGPVPIVMASTGAVYGIADGRLTEDHPAVPVNPYGSSKLATEQLLAFHAATRAIGSTVLRCFNIAGAVGGVGDSDLTRIIPKALAVAAGQADQVLINGDGKAVREFTHVVDVARAFSMALSSTTVGESRTFNVGSGVPTTMLDVVDAVERVTGKALAVEHGPAKHEPAVLMANSARIATELGWAPDRPGIDGIVRDAWAVLNRSS